MSGSADAEVTPRLCLMAHSGAARAGPPDVDDTEAGGPLLPRAQGGERRGPALPRRRPARARLLHRRLPAGAARPGAGRCHWHPGETGSGGPGTAHPKGQHCPGPGGLQTSLLRCLQVSALSCLRGRHGTQQGLKLCGLWWGLSLHP